MSVTYVKFCPHCETTNGVDAPACVKCGHKFRTQFQPPVSERTIAMTGDVLPQLEPDSDSPPMPAPVRSRRRPRFLGKAIILGLCAVVAFGAMRFGSHVARSVTPNAGTASPSPSYSVVFRGDAQGYPVPLATQSADDLRLYKPDGADSVSVGLYHAGRIVLVYPGTSAKVTQEGTDWHRVTLLSGARQGMSGFVNVASVQKLPDPNQDPGNVLPPPPAPANP